MCLRPVGDPFCSGHARAVGAAVEVAIHLHTVADHLHAAVLAGWGEGVDGALEAVEGARPFPGHTYLEGLGVPYTGYKRADTHGCCREIDAQERVYQGVFFPFLPLGNGAPPRGSGEAPFRRGNVQPTALPARELAAGRINYRGEALLPDKRLPSRAASTTWRMAPITRPGCSTWM